MSRQNKFGRIVRRLKKLAAPAKEFGFISMGLGLLLVLEAYSAWYAFASAPQADLWATPWGEYPRAALLKTGVSVMCGLIAFFGMRRAGLIRDDERKRVNARAWSARLVACGFLSVVVFFLSGALAFDRQAKSQEVYRASPAYEADVKTANDPMADRLEREGAKERLTPPATAERGPGDFFMAVFLHGLVMWSAGAFRAPVPVIRRRQQRKPKATVMKLKVAA